MTCIEVQNLLHMDPDGPLPSNVHAHLAQCEPCRQVQQELQTLRAALRDLAPPSLPSSFELQLRRRLAQSRPARGRSWAPTVLALAATVLLVASGLLIWHSQRPVDGPGVSAPAVSFVSHHRLHLSIHAAQAHGEALFDVQLPEGATLADGLASELGGGHVVRWRSDLMPGVNEIDLPIVLKQRQPAPAKVQAQLIASGKVYSTQIQLQSDSTGHARSGGASPECGAERAKCYPTQVSTVRLAFVLDMAPERRIQ